MSLKIEIEKFENIELSEIDIMNYHQLIKELISKLKLITLNKEHEAFLSIENNINLLFKQFKELYLRINPRNELHIISLIEAHTHIYNELYYWFTLIQVINNGKTRN